MANDRPYYDWRPEPEALRPYVGFPLHRCYPDALEREENPAYQASLKTVFGENVRQDWITYAGASPQNAEKLLKTLHGKEAVLVGMRNSAKRDFLDGYRDIEFHYIKTTDSKRPDPAAE